MRANALKLAIIGAMIGTMIFSCDRRKATGPNDNVMVGSIQVTLDPGQLRLPSPEAIDSALITILVLDTKGVGLPDINVNLTRNPEIGHITQLDSTDFRGRTTAWFIADPGIYDTTRITVSAGEKSASALLTIIDASSGIGSISASLQKHSIVADGLDTSSIYVTVLDSLDNPVEGGTIVYFAHTGIGQLMATQLPTINGQLRNVITGPSNIWHRPRVDSIFVGCYFEDSAYVADTVVVNYVPGLIYQMSFVYPESTVDLNVGSGDTCSIILLAADANGNPVWFGTQISFRHNTLIGSTITPQDPDTVNGYSRYLYTVGDYGGVDYVTAWVVNPINPQDTIRILPPVVFRCLPLPDLDTTLVLSAGNPRIHVDGDSSSIIATLQDGYGNPMSEGYYVAFDITAAPMDSAGRKPSFDPRIPVLHDTTATNINGQAIVMLYSGFRAGAVTIRACTVPTYPESLYVCDERPLVDILPGPPRYINIGFSYYGESIDPNLPERYVQVAAFVYDRFNNPVQYGTPVYFGSIPNYIGEIDSPSYTGGARPYHPDSSAGIAYSRIVYGCFNTFDTVRVIATSAGDSAEIIDTSAAYPLPIYQGEIGIYADPDSLWTPDSTCNSSDTSEISTTLVDGGGCAVEGGIITFATQIAGEIIGQNIDTTDVDGHAHARFMIRGCDIPNQPDGYPRIEAAVRATLAQKTSVFTVEPIICARP
jgi:hypothetical protein